MPALVCVMAWHRSGAKQLPEPMMTKFPGRCMHHQTSILQYINPVIANVPWWRHQMETFPRYWSFMCGIHRSPVNSPHKSQWRGSLKYSLIWAWTNGWLNNRKSGDLRHHRAHYDVTVLLRDITLINKHLYSEFILQLIGYFEWYSVLFISKAAILWNWKSWSEETLLHI